MPPSLRCFLAIRVPAHRQLVGLIRALDHLGRSVRGVNPDGIHVTLKFLGTTPVEHVAAIIDRLRVPLAARIRHQATIRGVGVFPSIQRPRVVWAGIEPSVLLTDIARVCEAVCQPLGYPAESRAFQPHATLARIHGRPPDSLASILAEQADALFGPLPIESVELMRSNPGSDTNRYTTIAAIPLGGTETKS